MNDKVLSPSGAGASSRFSRPMETDLGTVVAFALRLVQALLVTLLRPSPPSTRAASRVTESARTLGGVFDVGDDAPLPDAPRDRAAALPEEPFTLLLFNIFFKLTLSVGKFAS